MGDGNFFISRRASRLCSSLFEQMSWKKCIEFWASFSVCPDPVDVSLDCAGRNGWDARPAWAPSGAYLVCGTFRGAATAPPNSFCLCPFRPHFIFLIMIACARTLCWFSPLDMRVQLCSHVRLIFVPSGATTAFSLLPDRHCGK